MYSGTSSINGAIAGGYSNTQEKARVLPEVFSYDAERPALVVAFGTAARMSRWADCERIGPRWLSGVPCADRFSETDFDLPERARATGTIRETRQGA